MMIYALLNQDAKAWWYFQQLRTQGRTAEARLLERQSIRTHLAHIRTAKEHGKTLEVYSRGSFILNLPDGWLRGYGNEDDSPFVKACRLSGIPIIHPEQSQ